MVRGSFELIVSLVPPRNGYVASTTTMGRCPLAEKPILARTDVGESGWPSIATTSGAIA